MKHSASVQSIAGHLAVLLLCLGSGCVRSIQPVLKDSQVIADDRLLGSWVSSDGKTFGRVTPADDRKSYNLLVTGGDGKQADMVFRLGRIGDMTLADFTIQDPMPDASDIYKAHLLLLHSFLLIKQVVPNLVLATMDDGWFSKYIAAHPAELATVRPDYTKDDLLISATTDDLQAFLQRHEKDEGFFGGDTTFVRPGDPATQPALAPAKAP